MLILPQLLTFTRNNWGNNTGDIIQAKEVSEARKKPNIITAGKLKKEKITTAKKN